MIVFDYGEVISRGQSSADTDSLLAAAEADATTFWAAYWAHRDDLDQGRILPDAYWQLVAADLGASWDAPTRAQLWMLDFRSWISVEPGTVALLAELHGGGTRMAILSNAGFDFAGPLRYSPYGAYFESVFVSAELGLVKPDPAIYRVVADELGIEPSDMVFIDNKLPNVQGAESLGVVGHHFVGVDELRTFLTSLAVAS